MRTILARRRMAIMTMPLLALIAFTVLAGAILVPIAADASTSCMTRRSGSVTITSCSSSGHGNTSTTCRSYRSGSTVKTHCSR